MSKQEEQKNPFEMITKGLVQFQRTVTTIDQGVKVIDDMAKRIDNQFNIPLEEPKTVSSELIESRRVESSVYGAEAKTYKDQTDTDYCIECAVKHSQTAKVLWQEALQRAEASNNTATEGVKEKVRAAVKELTGLESDTDTVQSESVSMLNGAARDLRKYIYMSKAEIGGADVTTLREIKTMVNDLVEASYKVRETEECIGCTVEQICGGIKECVAFVEKNVEGVTDPAVIHKVLAEARRKYGRE